MEWAYQIMHKDEMVAELHSDGICSIENPDFLPYNLYLEEGQDIAVRVDNLNNFFYWCASRVLPLDRVYAKEILNAIGAGQGKTDRDRANIALSYHCLTLTDVFWTKKAGEKTEYRNINLYDHSLSDAFVEVSLLGKSLTVQNASLLTPQDCAGDVSIQGVVPKAWIRRDGVFYLLKDGGIRDVEAELLASRIARCFDVEQVCYEPYIYNGLKVSASRLFTSDTYGLAPMEYVDIYAANRDISRRELVEKYDSYGFYMMNSIDYLIGNTDRHWGNWGFLIDNRTNLPVKLHPLMDLNRSFLAYDTVQGSRCLTVETPMSQQEAAVEAVRHAGLNQIAEIRREWFPDKTVWEMFCRRLAVLKKAESGG